MKDAFLAEEIFPENVFVARHGDEVGAGEIVAAGIEAQADVVFVVDAFLFLVDFEEEGLEVLRGFGGFVFLPGGEIRMFVSGSGEVFGDALEGFGVEGGRDAPLRSRLG